MIEAALILSVSFNMYLLYREAKRKKANKKLIKEIDKSIYY